MLNCVPIIRNLCNKCGNCFVSFSLFKILSDAVYWENEYDFNSN